MTDLDRLHAARDAVERTVRLLLPADGHAGEVVSGPHHGQIDLHGGEDVVVAVTPPPPPGGTRGRVSAHLAWRRERARSVHALLTNPPRGFHVAGVHHAGRYRSVIELHRTLGIRRVIDEIREEIGAPAQPFSFVRGGIVAPHDEAHLVRMTPHISPATAALCALSGHPVVPRIHAWGQTAGAAWAIESSVPHRAPRRIGRALATDIVAFCASLPRHDWVATAPRDDLTTLRASLSDRETIWTLAEQRFSSLAAQQSIARHGDLRRRNIVASRGRLAHIVDWRGWHASAVPGADLLTAFALEPRTPLGTTVLRRPWRGDRFRHLTRVYWQALEIPASMDNLDAAGLAWWIGSVAAALRAEPELAAHDRWVHACVDTGAAAFV